MADQRTRFTQQLHQMIEIPLDRVLISGLRLLCIVGINDWERLVKQEVVLDIALFADLRQAGNADRIQHTVNYRTVAKKVTEAVEGSNFGLVEALAQKVADVCLEDPLVKRVDVVLKKPGAVRGSDWVGVEISRNR
jgi:FolB domain-containing protein